MARYWLMIFLSLLIAASVCGQADSVAQSYHERSIEAYYADDFPTAIAWAERALREQRALYRDSVALPLGKSLANLGTFHRNLSQFSRALPYLLEADEVFATLDNWRRRNNNREQLVYVHHATGELARAERLLTLMETALPEEVDDNVRVARAEIARLRGVQAVQEKRYGAARASLAAAGREFEAVGALGGWLEAGMEEARADFHLGNYRNSVAKARNLLSLAEEYEMHYDAAVLHNQLLLDYLRLGDFPAAETAYAAGLDRAALAGNVRVAAVLELSRAELAVAQGDAKALRRHGRAAIALLATGWSYSEETPVPSRDQLAASAQKADLFETLAEYAQLLESSADSLVTTHRETLEVVDAGDVMADLLRADLADDLSKLFWRENTLPLYALGLRLAARMNDQERAFYYLEKSRGLLLLDELRTATVLATVPATLREDLRLREDTLASLLRRQLMDTTGLVPAEDVRSARLAVDEARAELAARVPALRAVVTRPEIVGLAQARSNLATGGWDRQLQFLTTDDYVYVHTVTADTAYLQRVASQAKFAPALTSYLEFFKSRGIIEEAPADFLAAGYEVYRQLLEPLGIPAGERLLLLPDARLGYLPFAALVTEAGGQRLGSAPYLIRRHPVSYAVSSSALDEQAQDRELSPEDALAFAPFTADFPGRTASLLTASDAELAALANHYDPTELRTAEATRAALLERLPALRLAHLSTHAFPNEGEQPPRILTASGPVFLSDVYGLRLGTELVTLSACQSNIGAAARGEGVLGMGRAFAAAGARGVIASLWNLNDRSTAGIVADFYERLADGAPKPLALHGAQLAYLESSEVPEYLKSPYYWAGLTYYGNGRSLAAPTDYLLYGGGVALLLLLVLGYLAVRRR